VATSSSVYTATFAPAGQGACTVDVAAGVYTDTATNMNNVASQFNWTFDIVLPTLSVVSITSNNATNSNFAKPLDTVTLTMTASKPIGAPSVAFLSGNAATANTPTITHTGNNVWTAVYAVYITDGDGAITYTIDFTDLAGNSGTQVTNGTGNVTANISLPTLSSVGMVSNNTVSGSAKAGDLITLSFTSNRIITPTVVFQSGGAAVGNTPTITTTGNNVWTAVYTVGVADTGGSVTYTIAFIDLAGNSGLQVANGIGAVVVDVTLPTLTAVSIVSSNVVTTLAKPSNTITLTITASKTVSSPTIVFTTGGAPITGSPITIINTSGATWTATYIAVAGDTDGVVGFTVDFLDTIGNAGVQVNGVTDGSVVTFDSTLPAVDSFVMDDVALKRGETASVALTFSVSVPGFDSDTYITSVNGSLALMTSNINNTIWTGIFTPSNNIDDITNILTLAGGWVDSSGNVATQGATTANYAVNTSQPVLTSITEITYQGTPTVINRTPTFVFSSSEAGNITTENATFSSVTTAVVGNNSITFNRLADYTTHSTIRIIVTDVNGNPSVALTVPAFTVDTTVFNTDIITAVDNNTGLQAILQPLITATTNKSVTVISNAGNVLAAYKARIKYPDADFSQLSAANKLAIKSKVSELYAAELNISAKETIYVDVVEGSVTIEVYVMTAASVNSDQVICFPKGTPVTTNQGEIPIENLHPGVHTIRGRKITAITRTTPTTSHIVLIKKHALGKNVPCMPTQISNNHRVFYKGHMVKASDLVNMCNGVVKTPYNGETLYNVVMKKHDKMMINNLICETLHPDNVMARICAGDYTLREKVELCTILKRIGKTTDYTAYNKFYASLK
jgi:hypothetical protein